jgi:hypothetical protein
MEKPKDDPSSEEDNRDNSSGNYRDLTIEMMLSSRYRKLGWNSGD